MPPKKPATKPVSKPAAKTVVSRAQPAKTGAKKTTSQKQAAPVKKGASTKSEPAKESKPKEKQWTPQDEAARKIQTQIRKFLAKRKLEKKKQQKKDYEELMDKLEQEAFVKLVKMEQEQAEQQRQKEEELRRRKKEENKRKKRMLEAAFDGDIDEMNQVLKEVKQQDDKDEIGHDIVGQSKRNRHQMALVACEDANENTAVSEAASGGNIDVIKMLIEKGASPNTKGQFGRSPLYRAAFAGHLEAVQCLLQSGSDPRIYAEDGQTPEQVASHKGIVETLNTWDIDQTEKLLAKIEAEKEIRMEEDKKRKEVETGRLEDQVVEAESEYKTMQKNVVKCTEELNKRIFEHDHALEEGFDKPELLVQVIHDAEADLEIAKLNIEKARDKLSSVKLLLRDKQLEGLSDAEADDLLPGLKVMIRELEDVLLRDVGNRIKESGKWPLIIDTSGQASTFLTYRDTNYLNALNPNKMTHEIIRMALLGAIRYGKPLVIDLMEVDMFKTVTDRFNEIHPGLMDAIFDRSILTEEKYLPLIKETDGQEYDKLQFLDQRVKNFKFFVITKNPFPAQDLLERMYIIRIHIPT